MTEEVFVHSSSHLDLFRKEVVAALRQSGHLQRELAYALGINAQVLSRKLHGGKQTFLTHVEVKLIIKTLAAWDAITTQDEALQLLSFMGLKVESFSDQEWHSPPLNRLDPATRNICSSSSPLPLAANPSLASLPSPSASLLGRQQHTRLLLDRLRQPHVHLLTLLGTGGVGKTRLALEVAQAVINDFPDGVFFVPLATIRDVTLVPSTIVETLHLTEVLTAEEPGRQHFPSQEDFLSNFLHNKHMLLVLDNVEQLPTITSLICKLLRNAPLLKILVTSRTVLHLYGEHEFDVPPLAIPLPGRETDLEALSQLASVRLFVERAQAIHPAFQITPQNAATIARICTRLDGLPLAIELAAARTKVLSLSAILQRLSAGTGQSLTFLHSKAQNILQRHQTLHETLDWSYELLASDQQRLFRRLSVFVGGWTVQAALAVCLSDDSTATPDKALEQIEDLIDHSLVKRSSLEVDSFVEKLEPHFYFLETIREYALGRLEADGERQEIQQRHASYFLLLVETVEPALLGRNQNAAMAILTQEQDNLRAALTWSIKQNEAELVLRMSGALAKFWEARAQFSEAHLWIDAALPMTQKASAAVHAKFLLAASRLALWEMNYEGSRAFAQEALARYKECEDSSGIAQTIFQIGDTWHMQGEYEHASCYLEESLHLFSQQKNWGSYAFTLSRLGAIAMLQNNFSQAWTYLREALPLLREYSEPVLLNVTLAYLGALALIQGEMQQSMLYLHEGLLLAQQIDNRYVLAIELVVLGCLSGTIQERCPAAYLCSAAEVLFASLNTTLPEAYRSLYEAYLSSIKSQVDDALWQTWWTEGKALSQQEILDLAFQVCETQIF